MTFVSYPINDARTAQDKVAWPAADHWQRLMYMAEAYNLNTSAWYQNSGMKANFSKAFDYWFSGLFNNINPNWWFNQIGMRTKIDPNNALNINHVHRHPDFCRTSVPVDAQRHIGSTAIELRSNWCEGKLDGLDRAKCHVAS